MKLPKQAKKVFDGEIFDVYQWQQEMFDGTKETFEMLKRPNTVNVIATEGDRIVTLEQEQPVLGSFLSLIGGRQDEGEEPLETAKRELLEESGRTSNDWELFATYEPYSKIEWTVFVYIARNSKKIQDQNLDAGERITENQVDFDTFVQKVIAGEIREKDFNYQMARMTKSELEDFRALLFKK